jgi:signal transduction histidine kinase
VRQPSWKVGAAAGFAVGFADVVLSARQDASLEDLVVGTGVVTITIAAGLFVWASRPESRMGMLITAWGIGGFLADTVGLLPDSRVLVTIGWPLVLLFSAVYAHMVLAYPTGRIVDRIDRAAVWIIYVAVIVWAVPLLTTLRPPDCSDCSPRVPSLFFIGEISFLDTIGKGYSVLFIVLGAIFVGLIVRRIRRASPGVRRTLWPLAVAAGFGAAQFIARSAADLLGLSGWQEPLDWVGSASGIAVPVALAVGVLSTRRATGPVGKLVVELGNVAPGGVGAALAKALGDPTLELALWLPDRRAWVDEEGREVAVAETPTRAVTRIGDDLAAIVHDPDLADQQALLDAAGSAVRLALENERLHAELRVQLEELRASRARIVRAGDDERRRLERDLHDGAQQRLLGLGLALQLIRARVTEAATDDLVGEAEDELREALRELRDLARGIHPAVLVDQGLDSAIKTLARRASIPVHVTGTDGDRLPRHVETAAYFVVAEALANIARHADARHAEISVRRRNGAAIVEIRDDGKGGADADGSGLQGLADRVGSIDGTFAVVSPPGQGTLLIAEIPCA